MPGYAADRERGLLFDGPGACSMNFANMPFTGSARGVFPIASDPEQPIEVWRSEA